MQMFKASKAVSLQKSKSYILTQPPKKTKFQQEFDRVEEQKKTADMSIRTLKYKILKLNSKVEELKEKNRVHSDHTEKLSKLFDLGLIDHDGNPVKHDKSL